MKHFSLFFTPIVALTLINFCLEDDDNKHRQNEALSSQINKPTEQSAFSEIVRFYLQKSAIRRLN